ncbi:MAG: E7 protein [Lutjanus campechanus-associated papillomavirus 1]|uniref:E7 protein n=1 Tax=Lutjanus campechanus-associated papillomavirus 1 TaxID=2683335 RepID=A0A8F5XVA2_9PAPI|nr:MAG: E7 protein [Lutjanus campechanus-associated papillomavirus 1]
MRQKQIFCVLPTFNDDDDELLMCNEELESSSDEEEEEFELVFTITGAISADVVSDILDAVIYNALINS